MHEKKQKPKISAENSERTQFIITSDRFTVMEITFHGLPMCSVRDVNPLLWTVHCISIELVLTGRGPAGLTPAWSRDPFSCTWAADTRAPAGIHYTITTACELVHVELSSFLLISLIEGGEDRRGSSLQTEKESDWCWILEATSN